MPTKPKKPCKHSGCPNLTDGLYCEAHKQTENRRYNKYQRDPAINKRYGKEWRRIRTRYIKAHPLCEECKHGGRLTPATEVHHILPLSEGGTHDEQNLMALCHACHSAITMMANNGRKT
jgi:5-methylcytosine-specific restriction protein A